MLVGDNQTLHCGVKDGAHILAKTLSHIGFDVDVLAPDTWRPADVWKLLQRLRKERYDILHVQYPSIGYRTSLLPHVLGLLRLSHATVTTLHEFSAFPKMQQLSTHAFRLSAGTLLFGSEYERSRFNRVLGLIGAKQEVFPILSQIPAVQSSDRDATVVYFGQIRPHKGLEAYLELARRSLELNKRYNFHIMGSVSSAHETYARSLQKHAPSEILWSFDLPVEEIGGTLGRSFAAYLPFPDGASERRGTLLAALLNGLPVLSRIGSATTPEIRELLVIADDANGALKALDELTARPDEWERISGVSHEHAQKHSWEDVAKRHADVYRALLRA